MFKAPGLDLFLVIFAYLLLCRFSVVSVIKVLLLYFPLSIRLISSLLYLRKLKDGFRTLCFQNCYFRQFPPPIYCLFTSWIFFSFLSFFFVFFFLFLFVCLFVSPHLCHAEGPRPGIELAPQQWQEPQQWHWRILNPLRHQRMSSCLGFFKISFNFSFLTETIREGNTFLNHICFWCNYARQCGLVLCRRIMLSLNECF